MAKLVLAGVPEQVNIPISICRERGIFEKHGLEVEFRSVPEGTGKMLNMIEEGEVDVALTVADATIIGCAKGRPLQICGAWVNSPLVWAIAGARKKEPKRMGSNRNGIVDLSTYNASHGLPLRFGISRPGSGSQSMAQYCCMVNQLQPCELQFEVANDFKGLREGTASPAFTYLCFDILSF
jgi:ABC-type nitrate/sulfonate/bicarbonate transport system substrate-binding protein